MRATVSAILAFSMCSLQPTPQPPTLEDIQALMIPPSEYAYTLDSLPVRMRNDEGQTLFLYGGSNTYQLVTHWQQFISQTDHEIKRMVLIPDTDIQNDNPHTPYYQLLESIVKGEQARQRKPIKFEKANCGQVHGTHATALLAQRIIQFWLQGYCLFCADSLTNTAAIIPAIRHFLLDS